MILNRYTLSELQESEEDYLEELAVVLGGVSKIIVSEEITKKMRDFLKSYIIKKLEIITQFHTVYAIQQIYFMIFPRCFHIVLKVISKSLSILY